MCIPATARCSIFLSFSVMGHCTDPDISNETLWSHMMKTDKSVCDLNYLSVNCDL